jgi:hypothetical protein
MLILQPDQDTGFDRPTLARIENEIDEAVWALVLPGRREPARTGTMSGLGMSRPWPPNTFPPRIAARSPGAGSASIDSRRSGLRPREPLNLVVFGGLGPKSCCLRPNDGGILPSVALRERLMSDLSCVSKGRSPRA